MVVNPTSVEVRYGKLRWSLADGRSLSVGRQSGCDIRVGSPSPGPEDLGVSRRAATLTYAQGRVWIRNDSASQAVYVRPAVGAEHVLDRRGDIVSVAAENVDVVLEGHVLTYRLAVEVIGRAPVPGDEDPETASPATRAALPLTQRERRLLVAVCFPLLTPSGLRSRPASYREAAVRLGLSEHTVRNHLDELRNRLADMGIPGLVGPEGKDTLARYAVRSGSVTVADIDGLKEAGK